MKLVDINAIPTHAGLCHDYVGVDAPRPKVCTNDCCSAKPRGPLLMPGKLSELLGTPATGASGAIAVLLAGPGVGCSTALASGGQASSSCSAELK